MNEDDIDFLQMIQVYVSKRPDVGAYVAQYAAAGVSEALDKTKEQCSHLEIALYAALSKRRFKGIDKLIIDRIKDFVSLGVNYIRWDSFLKETEMGDKK